MSTSDAEELELRVVGGGGGGGERATPPYGTERATRTERANYHEKPTRRHNDETPTDEQRHRPGIRREEIHKAGTLRVDGLKKDEASDRGDSDLQHRRFDEPRFSTSLFLRLSKNFGFDRIEPEHRKASDSCRRSVIEAQHSESKDCSSQVNGVALSPLTSKEETSVHSPSETPPANRGRDVTAALCNEQDLSLSHTFSNGGLGPQKHQRSHVHASVSLPGTLAGSLTTQVESQKDITDQKKLENRADLEGLSDPSVSMLSSTVVSVLAPHWSGRLRRPKKGDAAGSSDAQGNLQDPSTSRALGFQENMSASGSQASFLGSRSFTVGWPTKGGPPGIERGSQSNLARAVSLDVNSGKAGTEKMDAGAVSPLSPTASSSHLDHNDPRRNQQPPNQGRLSTLSSKPTTSGLLLSLRRINSTSRNSDAASSSPSDPNGKLSATHLSQSFLNNNEQKQPKPLLSPSSLYYRTTEPGPVLSPSSANQRERNKSDSLFFPTSQINKVAENAINKAHSSLLSSAGAFLSKGPTDRPQNIRTTDKSVNPLSETSGSQPRHTSFDHAPLQKTPSVPRATLTSTTWWKQVTQDSASLTRNDAASVKDKLNTPSSQIPNNRDNNRTTESLFKGVLEPQGGAADHRQRNVENSSNHKSDKRQYGSNLNNKQPQQTYTVPDVLSRPKFSRTPAHVTLSHLKDPSKHDASSSYSTTSVPELPPTLPSPRSSNTPTDNSSEYNKNHCPPSFTSTHMDTHQFTRPPRSPTFTSPTLTSQASPSPSALSPTSNTKSSSPFHPASSQANVQPSSYAGSSSQTPKLTDRVTTTTPLGFERNYASIPKPFQTKTLSSLMATPFSKTNFHRTSIPSDPSPSTTSTHPKASSPYLLSPPVTPAPAVPSILTPPATPDDTDGGTSSPKVTRTFTSSLEREPKKKRMEGKRVRRVTFDPSVDSQCSEKQDTSPVPSNTVSTFSFLRSGSPTSRSPSPLSSPSPNTGGKFRSLSSDSAELVSWERERNKLRNGDSVNFELEAQGLTPPRQERTLSVESGTVQCHSMAPLSLPPDFSRSYKLRYSSPPYSTLMSSRLAQGESKPITPRSPLFPQESQTHYSFNRKPDVAAASSKPPPSPTRASQPQPFQIQTATKDGSQCVDQVNNNHVKNTVQPPQSSSLLLVTNRVNFGSQSLQGDKAPSSSSACATETLIYNIKSKVDAAPVTVKSSAPKPLQYITNTPVSVETDLSQHAVQSREAAAAKSCRHSDVSSSGSSSTESQSHVREGRKKKESMLGKSRFLSVEVRNEQSPKKSRFNLKKSVSTPDASLSRSDSKKGNKSGTKMDQVLHKIREKFTKRSDDDPSFTFRWRRGSQAPSVSGSSDLGNVSDESTKTLEEQVEEKKVNEPKKSTEEAARWTQNRYIIIESSTVGKPAAGDQFSSWSDKGSAQANQQELNVGALDTSPSTGHAQLRVHSPTMHQYDIYKDKGSTDYNAPKQLLPCRDPSPCRSPNSSGPYQYKRSTPSPRSPFSPFASLSPVSPFSTPDPADDVFYSPKLQRRTETPSPCEPGEGVSLRGPRRSRLSTGPPSVSPGQDADQLASSYADLKYGIEPGRSFSVSSVLSSRPSGPGRISTGSRFMSVGDLSQAALSCGGSGAGLDQWPVAPEGASEFSGQPNVDTCKWFFPHDAGKFRSRSLPRSLTRRLANWGSEASDPRALATGTLKPAHLRSSSMNICHFPWDAEGPPTPPPTPPLSPVSRRMSKPPSLSSPTFPSTSGAPPADGQSSKGRLHSRGYTSSFSSLKEFSDSSSDTTTDGDYYLESDEEEKETEL